MTSASSALGGEFPLAADLLVSRVGFGAMQLAGPGVFGPPSDRERSIRVLRRAVELGINHIDTCDYYGPWVVNELIAEALHPYGDDLVLVTKIGSYRDHQGGWLPLGHPDALRAQVHDNLRRLRLEALDLVYLRYLADQPGITLADQLGALIELREQGLLRNIGLSNVSAAQFEEAQRHTRIAAVQNLYNVVNRTSAELLEKAAAAGAAFVPFFPLGSGFADSRARADGVLRAVAERRGATQAQVSLAWLLRRSPNILLIPGTSSVEHLQENTAAADLELTAEDVAELDAMVADGETLEAAH
ncbi:oxidoreductase [Saccharopolyspora sp. 5N708]|uniref:oxidoreductase n=1 Tax=Saccharopolyspora sp. 5N708 TaxID=3457424 RepID=UPI003FD4E416